VVEGGGDSRNLGRNSQGEWLSIGEVLAEFVGKGGGDFAEVTRELGGLIKAMDLALADSAAPLDLRLGCLSLLAQRKWEDVQSVFERLLQPGRTREVRRKR
jgi:hypothetical protein